MVVAIGDKEVELEKNVTFKPKKKCCNFRLTVEPLGFLVLTAGIIQVKLTTFYSKYSSCIDDSYYWKNSRSSLRTYTYTKFVR